jgi:hypothetical protein
MLLLPRELHAHRPPDRARQQRRIGGDVVGTIAAVTPGRLEPNDVDLRGRHLHQQRKVGPQRQWILRARPDGQAVVATIGNGAGGPYGAVQLVRPEVGARHASARLLEPAIDRTLYRAEYEGGSVVRRGRRAHPACRGMRQRAATRRASRCAASAACSSRSATIPTKSRITTTATMPSRAAREDSSTSIRLVPTKGPLSRPT